MRWVEAWKASRDDAPHTPAHSTDPRLWATTSQSTGCIKQTILTIQGGLIHELNDGGSRSSLALQLQRGVWTFCATLLSLQRRKHEGTSDIIKKHIQDDDASKGKPYGLCFDLWRSGVTRENMTPSTYENRMYKQQQPSWLDKDLINITSLSVVRRYLAHIIVACKYSNTDTHTYAKVYPQRTPWRRRLRWSVPLYRWLGSPLLHYSNTNEHPVSCSSRWGWTTWHWTRMTRTLLDQRHLPATAYKPWRGPWHDQTRILRSNLSWSRVSGTSSSLYQTTWNTTFVSSSVPEFVDERSIRTIPPDVWFCYSLLVLRYRFSLEGRPNNRLWQGSGYGQQYKDDCVGLSHHSHKVSIRSSVYTLEQNNSKLSYVRLEQPVVSEIEKRSSLPCARLIFIEWTSQPNRVTLFQDTSVFDSLSIGSHPSPEDTRQGSHNLTLGAIGVSMRFKSATLPAHCNEQVRWLMAYTLTSSFRLHPLKLKYHHPRKDPESQGSKYHLPP